MKAPRRVLSSSRQNYRLAVRCVPSPPFDRRLFSDPFSKLTLLRTILPKSPRRIAFYRFRVNPDLHCLMLSLKIFLSYFSKRSYPEIELM